MTVYDCILQSFENKDTSSHIIVTERFQASDNKKTFKVSKIKIRINFLLFLTLLNLHHFTNTCSVEIKSGELIYLILYKLRNVLEIESLLLISFHTPRLYLLWVSDER